MTELYVNRRIRTVLKGKRTVGLSLLLYRLTGEKLVYEVRTVISRAKRNLGQAETVKDRLVHTYAKCNRVYVTLSYTHCDGSTVNGSHRLAVRLICERAIIHLEGLDLLERVSYEVTRVLTHNLVYQILDFCLFIIGIELVYVRNQRLYTRPLVVKVVHSVLAVGLERSYLNTGLYRVRKELLGESTAVSAVVIPYRIFEQAPYETVVNIGLPKSGRLFTCLELLLVSEHKVTVKVVKNDICISVLSNFALNCGKIVRRTRIHSDALVIFLKPCGECRSARVVGILRYNRLYGRCGNLGYRGLNARRHCGCYRRLHTVGDGGGCDRE